MTIDKYDRHKAYRERSRVKGRCPHCGKFCAPYYECEERREKKRVARNRGIYNVKVDDKRYLPRRKDKEIKEKVIENVIEEVKIKENGIIQCKCPVCDKIHIRIIKKYEWAGRGMPRINCIKCDNLKRDDYCEPLHLNL